MKRSVIALLLGLCVFSALALLKKTKIPVPVVACIPASRASNPVKPADLLEAERDVISDFSYSFRLPPCAEPTLIHVGSVPNPTSIVTAGANDQAILLAVFEPTAKSMAVFQVCKATREIKTHVVPDAYISYGIIPDRNDPDVFWISTCDKSQLFRLNCASGKLEKILEIEGEACIFTLDQHADGTLYLGTWPGAKCLRVRVDTQGVRRDEIAIDPRLIEGRKYLHHLFVSDEGTLYLHYGSPGLLLRHELSSGKTVEIARADVPFLNEGEFAKQIGPLDRKGQKVLPLDIYKPHHTIVSEGLAAKLCYQDQNVRLSLRPRKAGMHITSFQGVGHDRAVGNTYWNHWMFQVDMKKRQVAGIGVAGDCGEFFTAGSFQGQVAIPHYQGVLLVYDPTKPYQMTPAAAANPRVAARVPHAHYGTSCIEDGAGRLFYTTGPNYHRSHGMLIRFQEGEGARVLHDADPTYNRLALMGDRLFASTMHVRGLGVGGQASQQVTQIVELSGETGAVLDSVSLQPETSSPVVDLVPLSSDRLLAGMNDGSLYRIDRRGSPLRCTLIQQHIGGQMMALARLGPQHVLILMSNALLAYDCDSGKVLPLMELPVSMNFLAVSADGDVFMASTTDIYCVTCSSLANLLSRQE